MKQEDKAKAYDKVRKKIAIRFGSNVADEFFAEFEGSKDEKIRKRLITDFGTIGKKEWGGLEVKDILAWLEKQGEKPDDKVEPKFKVGEKELTDEELREGLIRGMINEHNRVVKEVLRTEYEKGRADAIAEMQGKWSEEDEHRIKDTIYFLDTAKKHYASTEELDACIDWVKSLKDRVQPQPKQEWSEEDINIIDWLIRCCEEEHKELCNDKYGHQDIVSDLKRDCRKKWDWLESLKNRLAPQNTWKPSKEQMDALAWALSLAKNCGEECAFDLRTLHEQLEKLKEE